MHSSHKHPEISTHMIRLIIGLIAISLPFLTSFLADRPLTSISASYYDGDWPRNIFVGFLISISALFLAYNGTNQTEFYLSKIGSVAPFLIATFPESGSTSVVHGIASIIMFSVLAIFCYQFHKSAKAKYRKDPEQFYQAKIRSNIYMICGITIVVAMLLVALKGHFHSAPRIVFYCETAGLLAFGFAWLVASLIIPIKALNNTHERVSPFMFVNK